jgi:hypothetical protein
MTQPESALTVSRLVDETVGALHGYVRDQAAVTSLSASMTDTDLEGAVTEDSQVSRGLIEIDEELIYVNAVGSASLGTFSIPPWGRAQHGTVAASHADGSKVTQSPLYPRRRVRDAIYWVLREIFPRVYGVATTTFDVDVVKTNYALPVDTWQVFTVEWHLPGPSFMWQPMKRWRVNHTATTQELEMLGMRWPGPDRGRATYSKLPPVDYGTEDLTSYGYTQNVHDIIILGATARLLAMTEPARLQVESVESHGRSEVVQGGSIIQAAQRLYAMFDRRVEQEAYRLQQRFTLQPHKTR